MYFKVMMDLKHIFYQPELDTLELKKEMGTNYSYVEIKVNI